MYQVIVIDDNRIVVQSIVQTIDWTTLGCAIVGFAYNGLDGLVLAKKCMPDIIITDIRMPGYDGLEMIHILHETYSKAKIIVITGYSDFSYAQTALRLGVKDFILKPIVNEELAAAVEKITTELSQEPVPITRSPDNPVDCALNQIHQNSSHYSTLIKDVITYIDNKILENPCLSDIGQEFSISQSHLSKCFKKEVGCSFGDYLTLCKMSHARAMLKNPKNRVYEVGLMLGYKDYTYFYQVFKKLYGCSPSEFK